MSRDLVVVGAGAAGMIAAWRAATIGARVRLLEKNARPGLKIHISGGGKCNITHSGSMEALRRAFTPDEARFLHAPFRRFTNEDVLRLMHSHGVHTHARPDGRVFPDSGRADDVVAVFTTLMREAGVQLHLETAVTGIAWEDGRVTGVDAGGRHFPAGAVIVAVGGSSYPKVGTTGDGYRWMRALGLRLAPLRPALAPIYLQNNRPEYSGVALRDCMLRVRQSGKERARWRGDLLFTHHGVSGPTVLAVSHSAAVNLEAGEVRLEVDVLPDCPADELLAEFQAAHAGPRKLVRSLLSPHLPERLLPDLLERAGVSPSTPIQQLGKRERNRLIDGLKRWDLGPVRGVPLEKGEVTAGGVMLDEVDPQTMACRRLPGLYLCGEILDLQGPVGGYNLQAAFSTGYVAGEAAAASVMGNCAD